MSDLDRDPILTGHQLAQLLLQLPDVPVITSELLPVTREAVEAVGDALWEDEDGEDGWNGGPAIVLG